MQNIVNIISILAFMMSLATLIHTIFDKSVRLSVNIKDYGKYFNGVVQLYIYFQNNSGRDLTISGISIVSNSQKYPCKMLPEVIRDCNGKSVITTPYLPVNIAPYQGVCYAFEFLNCRDIELSPGKTVDLEIYTNRTLLKRSLVLGDTDKILHL